MVIDLFDKDIDEYYTNQLVDILDNNGIHRNFLSIIEKYSDGGNFTVGALIENLIIAPGQTVNVECIDNEYGNSNYEIVV
jgi:hypothetical protein